MQKSTSKFKNLKEAIILLFLLAPIFIYAQPSIQWQKCYGGTKMENTNEMTPTRDGGYIMIGQSKSNDGNITGHHTGSGGTNTDIDVWIVKTDSLGAIQWQKSFGGTNTDIGFSIKQTIDSGYIFIGATISVDGDVVGNHGNYDAWLVKLDKTGNIQWQKCLGGSSGEIARTIEITPDSGYVIGAVANSNDGDVSGKHGLQDIWVVKLDVNGNIQWQKCLGGTQTDGPPGLAFNVGNPQKISICLTGDGGYFIGSNSTSIDGDVTGHHGPGGLVTIGGVSHLDTDYWVIKLDNTGALQWQKSLGGTYEDWAYSVLATNDNGYIVAGNTSSTDGDVSGTLGAGLHSWIVKLDSLGIIKWQKLIGATGIQSWTHHISKTNDGNFFLTGKDGAQAWVYKMNGAGSVLWQKLLGGTSTDDVGIKGFNTNDGGYILSGWTSSNNGDVSGNHGSSDFWLVKLFPVPANTISGTIYEDLNKNCLKDSGEVGLANQIVKAMPGNYFATTDANGDYTLFVDTGIYNVSHTTQVYYNQSCPILSGGYNPVINILNPNSFNNNFADTLTSHCIDVKVNVTTPSLRLCRRNTYALAYKNIGALSATNVSITVNFDPAIIPLSSSLPWSIVGGQYVFSIGTLAPNQGGILTIVDSVSCTTSTGILNCTTANIATTNSECDVVNNNASDCHNIISSCDPNGIEVQSQISNNGYVLQENITASDTLAYIIRFQNTGTDTAYTVVVRDTLSNYLNPASIELDAASHPYTFRIYENGICEWLFNDILLPDSTTNEIASHGFIKFKVKQASNNNLGTKILNRAAIWFDYNQAVITNTTTNIIPLVTNTENLAVKNLDAKIYPNPFSTSATISLSEELVNGEIIIYDLLGSEVKILKNISSKQINIERNSLMNGLYFYSIYQKQKQVHVGKFIIQ